MKIFNLTINQWIRYFRLRYQFNYITVIAAFIIMNSFTTESITRLVVATLTFFMMYSGIYVFNDIFDYEKDKLNPMKKNTPLQMGLISRKDSAILAASLIFIALAIFAFIDLSLLSIAIYFVLLNIAYTFVLKKIPYVDIVANAITHPLRYFWGVVISGVPIYVMAVVPPMYIVFIGACILSAEKRYFEIIMSKSVEFRPTLKKYSERQLIVIKYLLLGLFILFPIFYDIDLRLYGVIAMLLIFDVLPLQKATKKQLFTAIHS